MIGSAIPPTPWYWLTAALVMTAVGCVLWLNGIRAARPLVAVLMVAIGAAAGFLAPVLWHATLARLTTVITGIIAGLIFGGFSGGFGGGGAAELLRRSMDTTRHPRTHRCPAGPRGARHRIAAGGKAGNSFRLPAGQAQRGAGRTNMALEAGDAHVCGRDANS